MGRFTPLGYQQIPNVAAAVSLTVPNGAQVAMIRANTKDVRWRDDGTPPTAAVGTPLVAGETLAYEGNLAAIQFIEQAASAALDIDYYA
jgi:hypothetical protein